MVHCGPRGDAPAVTSAVGAAYSATGAAWQAGPGRIYDRLADVMLEHSPVALAGARVLDVGAGTGAATRAARRAGAQEVVAVDIAAGMLLGWADDRPPAAVADARCLPFAGRTFDAVVAAFSINHVPDPPVALADAARVLVAGGVLLASAYADDDTHPVKEVVEGVLSERGWTTDEWYTRFKRETVPLLATPERAEAAATQAGLTGATAERLEVPFADLGPRDLVEWRLGMAPVAPFVARLTAAERDELVADAIDGLGPKPPPLVRRIVVLTWTSPDP